MKKPIVTLLSCAMVALALTACGGSASPSASGGASSSGSFNASRPINVVSREDGSGTRTAFIELFGIEVRDANGNRKDMTTKEATVTNKTDVMLATVEKDVYSIGYVSLGSLNPTVKAVSIDGAQATPENIKSGAYKISREFNIATKGEATGLSKDFIDYIMSREGQEIVAKSYIAKADNAQPYSGAKPSGKLTIAGSSSVSPIMEKLKEGYLALNSGATIEIQTSDSTSGLQSAIEGSAQIAMSSRELKDDEKAVLTSRSIATDGIAVIVNRDNPLSDATKERIKAIFTGEDTTWEAKR